MSDEIQERLNKLHKEQKIQKQMEEIDRRTETVMPEQTPKELEAARKKVAFEQESLRLLEKDNTEKMEKRKRAMVELGMMGGMGVPSEVIPSMPCPCGSGKAYKDCHGSINR